MADNSTAGGHIYKGINMSGRIMKGIAGFYYVFVEGSGLYECKAKGIFRHDKKKPLVGDYVEIEITDEKEMSGSIVKILPRRNQLIRPEVANIDQALVIFALMNPEPNLVMLDKMILQYQCQNIPVIICFNKEDLADMSMLEEMRAIYENSGCKLLFTSTEKGQGIDEVRAALRNRTTSVAGPSGVGKSSLINCLLPEVQVETGAVSKKLKRGRHTTRHSEIFQIATDSYIMDTPGFSSFELFDITKENLGSYYEEFASYGDCRFLPCSHTHEPGCQVKEAVQNAKINEKRYEQYVQIYREIKEQRRY